MRGHARGDDGARALARAPARARAQESALCEVLRDATLDVRPSRERDLLVSRVRELEAALTDAEHRARRAEDESASLRRQVERLLQRLSELTCREATSPRQPLSCTQPLSAHAPPPAPAPTAARLR